ncbi:hypothetical protein GCM10010439_41420 [Actinocorallia aurantiaca]|uniref:Uncharacterized protein n=1 Tax=Actinocorallia aurantiaca TaxID=46204 RepID=A0ABN3UCP6_9ACTN
MTAPAKRPPRVRAYQATECEHPDSSPAGALAPSMATTAPGSTAAKSSFSRPCLPGSVPTTTRTPNPYGWSCL